MRIRRWRYKLVCLLVIYAMVGLNAAFGEKVQKITVFTAASTTNAITEIAKLFEQSHAVGVRLSFASSSTLAKQIEKGAPADIFLSANPKWMDYLAGKGVIVAASRTDLLGNRIVLIAPQDSSIGSLTVDSALDLAGLLGEGRLAMGDPDHVPAGIYGKQALEKLGLWESIQGKIARAKDVRAALVLVERGEAPLGEVYATDAAISSKVRIVGMFPEDSHPPIIYPVAVTTDSKSSAAGTFIEFLRGPAARAVFEKYGFSVR